MGFGWEGLTKHAPDYIKPSQTQLSSWAELGDKVLIKNNIPCK